jgi:hypothetical protein
MYILQPKQKYAWQMRILEHVLLNGPTIRVKHKISNAYLNERGSNIFIYGSTRGSLVIFIFLSIGNWCRKAGAGTPPPVFCVQCPNVSLGAAHCSARESKWGKSWCRGAMRSASCNWSFRYRSGHTRCTSSGRPSGLL